MKKAKSISDALRTEYKRSDFKKLERGKYYEHAKKGIKSSRGTDKSLIPSPFTENE